MTPRINPSIPPATLPFRGLPKDDDVYVMRNPLLRKRASIGAPYGTGSTRFAPEAATHLRPLGNDPSRIGE